MDKGLQEVIDKLKASKQQVPQAQPVPQELPPSSDFDEEDEDETDAEFYDDKEKPVEDKKTQTDAVKTAEMEMELLQNNGRFRAEMLYQLQELNKALVVIAQVLMQKR